MALNDAYSFKNQIIGNAIKNRRKSTRNIISKIKKKIKYHLPRRIKKKRKIKRRRNAKFNKFKTNLISPKDSEEKIIYIKI